jgi:hypothetical protein
MKKKLLLTSIFIGITYIAYGCINTTDESYSDCTVTTNQDEIEVIYIPSGEYDSDTHKVFIDSKDFIQ